MKRKNKIYIEPKYILMVLTVLCVITLVVSFQFKDKVEGVKTFTGYVISPMQKGINTVGTYIFEKLDTLKRMQALLDENASLKEKVASLEFDNKILQQDKYELDRLRTLFELDSRYASMPKVAARVISTDPGNWYSSFTIDKGSDDGLSVDMNVMAGSGLVGIITEVGHNYSKVRSIIDDSSSVSAMVLKSSDTCIVNGDMRSIDKGYILVELLSKDAQVRDGEEIVTSYISNKYLSGILVGYISNIEIDSTNMTKTAHLTPAVDFEHLQEVLVITELKQELH